MASPPTSTPRASHLHKRVGKYFLGRTIGEGTYAKVKYGQHSETGEAVAIKVLDKEALVRSGMVEQIKREISILKQIRHPHIVNLLEVMSSRDKIFMVMELVTGGELFDRVVAQGPMKEPAARRVFSQLLDAVGYCHQQGVYHRDLKPENVLLSSNGAVKLSDFGLGVLPNPENADALLRTTCGTPNYVAPEVLAKNGYKGGPADVWSLGVVLYVILAGCLPFDEDDLPTLFHKISGAQYEVPPWLSPDAVGLLATMLNPVAEARPTVEQLWRHPWMRSGLMRRSVLVPQGGWVTGGLGDILAEENVKPEVIKQAYQNDTKRRLQLLSPRSQRKLNAFELLKAGLDISALFEARDDVVARHTRFSSKAPLGAIVASIETAAVAVGGRVERQDEGRLRLHIPNPKGAIHVLVELMEVLPGTHMVDLQKVKGNTADFHAWYADLTTALASIISKKQPGPRGDVGAARMAARRREEREAGGQLRKNAFELIASSFNVGALFEEEQATARHVQFSSRRPCAEILGALGGAVEELGGSVQRRSEKRMVVTVPVGTSRTMQLQAHLFEVLPGVHVCQIEKDAGSSLDFMKVYAQLAGRLAGIMMKQTAFPTATRASQLLAVTPSMTDLQRHAIAELVPGSCSASSDGGSSFASPSGASPPAGSSLGASSSGGALAENITQRLAAAGLWRKSATTASKAASLGSVPEGAEEEEEHGQHLTRLHRGSAGGESRSSSTPTQGSSPLAGGSPKGAAWAPLPPLAESPAVAATAAAPVHNAAATKAVQRRGAAGQEGSSHSSGLAGG